MDDKYIYYLVLGAIYLISRMLKKKKPKPPIVSRPTVHQDSYRDKANQDYQKPIPEPVPQKPSSFEDLLKEISQEFTDRREPESRHVEIEEPISVIEPVEDHSEHTREQEYVEMRKKEIAKEERKKEIKKLLAEEDELKPHAVLELLHEDGGAANAVILSEIMNRKY